MPKSAKLFLAYILSGAVHDALYCTKGGGLFVREECDDIFRGMLRYSGISLFRAGVADKCVEWFEGGGKHWGNDEDGNADSVAVRVAI